MGVVTYDMEIASPIAPVKLFKAFVLDADNLIPKILPQAIKSVEILEGDGGHGPIKFTTFGEGSQLKTMKQRIDGIDKENFTYSYTIIDGDALVGTVESISNEIKILPSPKQQYITKGDIEITEEQIKGGKEKARLCSWPLRPTSWQILMPSSNIEI